MPPYAKGNRQPAPLVVSVRRETRRCRARGSRKALTCGQSRSMLGQRPGGSSLRPGFGVRLITPAQWLGTACVAHAVAIGTVWWHVSGGLLFGGHPGGRAVALGRLAGLLVSSAVLLQLALVSRLPGIEPSLGCDRLYRLHRRLGFAIGSLFLGHPALLTFGYARWHHLSLRRQFVDIARDLPHALPAIAAPLS